MTFRLHFQVSIENAESKQIQTLLDKKSNSTILLYIGLVFGEADIFLSLFLILQRRFQKIKKAV